MDTMSPLFWLLSVRWFQAHPSRYSLGAPVEVWCKDLFECEGESTLIPIQRISGKFIPVQQLAFPKMNMFL